MFRSVVLVPIALAVCLLQPLAATAQSPDSVVFHSGQWGTQFTLEGGFHALGFLHFTSPTRAWLLDLGTGYGRSWAHTESDTVSGDRVDLTARLGRRSYHSFGSHLYRLLTVGATLSYNWNKSTQKANQDSLTYAAQGFGTGVFADIGASWLVTPHLALGAQYGLALAYSHRADTGPFGGSTSNQIELSFGRVSLLGQFFF